jgi:hypothetical protein
VVERRPENQSSRTCCSNLLQQEFADAAVGQQEVVRVVVTQRVTEDASLSYMLHAMVCGAAGDCQLVQPKAL